MIFFSSAMASSSVDSQPVRQCCSARRTASLTKA
jgi:hypothetical protein